MVQDGLINKIKSASTDQKRGYDLEKISKGATLKKIAQEELLNTIQQAGQSGDLETILAAEKMLLIDEKRYYSNDGAMEGSLDIALDEINAATRLAGIVLNSKEYQKIDQSYSLPKNRTGGLPNDEARQFYRSHSARLLNLLKARLSPEEKAIIKARKTNIQIAGQQYIRRQKKTLELGNIKSQGKEQGKGLDM